MTRFKLWITLSAFAILGVSSATAQSKKEIIAKLTNRLDSVQKALYAREESIHQLEVKMARLEGAAAAHNEIITRIESKSDSLRDALTGKNATIETLQAQLNQLNSQIEGFQSQEKEWNSKNQALQAELNIFKEKAGVPVASQMSVGPAKEIAKTEVPTSNAPKATSPNSSPAP